MFCEFARSKYGDVIENIKNIWKTNSYNDAGSYIAPLPETFTKKYIKAIIDTEYLGQDSDENTIDNLTETDNITIFPNPINETGNISIELQNNSSVTVEIYDTNNNLKKTLLKGKYLGKGKYSFSIDASLLQAGINLCIVTINDKVHTRKILKK